MAEYTGLDGCACTPFSISGGIGVGACGLTDCNLQLNSVNRMDFQIGGVDALGLDNACITGFNALADTCGQCVYLQTQCGGLASVGCGGVAGGFWWLRTGRGSAAGASSNGNGGCGGLLLISTGCAGAADPSCADCVNGGGGANSGAICIFSGCATNGGAATGCGANGGSGGCTGSISLVTQDGGNGGASTLGIGGNGGQSGCITIRTGFGGFGGTGIGCTCGGDAGVGGDITIRTGAGRAAVEGGAASASGTIFLSPGNVLTMEIGRTTCNITTIGFFGACAVAQPAHIADVCVCCVSAVGTAVNSILAQLASLGLQAAAC
jgi:hypothetical protein